MGASVIFSVQRRGLRCTVGAVVVTSCTPGLLSLGLAFGFIQGSAVTAGLSHAPHTLHTIHHL